MKKFDTQVQYLKFKVLREVAKHAWDDTLDQSILDIPKDLFPGKTPTLRCCVYKERAIVAERVKLAMGGNKDNPNVIEVIDIACDDCPSGGYEVTNSCRGCLSHRCQDACKKDAIVIDKVTHTAYIDKSKCVECGACAKVCPYSAIANRKRPCQSACKIKAISKNTDLSAKIDNDKCISCGACVYQCPFGAIVDKSYIVDVIKTLKGSFDNKNYKVYCVVAPAISSQFKYAKLGQVISAIKKLGFYSVVEAALGADMVAYSESDELMEKGMLTSSCCPAFKEYIKNYFPKFAHLISSSLSPMASISKYLKEQDPTCKVVFIGPCTAKKKEIKDEKVKPYVDYVMTFEELQAIFDSKEIDLTTLEEEDLDNASYFGRIFARCGGLSEAIEQAYKEKDVTDFHLKGVSCDGIEECKMALLKLSAGKLDANFIEGMACIGGCIGGAGCLTHGEKNKIEVDKHGALASDKKIKDSIKSLKEKK